MDRFFDSLADQLGDTVSTDHIKLITCIVATYPLALIYRKLPAKSPTTRHLFSIGYALFTIVSVLKLYIRAVHIGLTAIFTWTFMKYFRGKNGPYVNFAVAMLSMAICHIDRQLKGNEGDSKLDYSGPLMITESDNRNSATIREAEYNKRMKIDRYPTLFEYFGWLCFFGGFFVGPTCEYMEYYRYTNYFLVSSDKQPSPCKPALRQIMLGILFGGITAFIGSAYNCFRFLDDDYLALPFCKKLLSYYITGFVWRLKFYCVWLLAEGSCILSQFGYNGVDKEGNHRWDRMTNVDWVAVETSQSMQHASTRWNRSTTSWLRHYVYNRLCPPDTSKPTSLALIATYVVSGLWHGFHPGYYGLLCSTGLIQILGRRIRRAVRPLVMSAKDPLKKSPLTVYKTIYNIAGNVVTMMLGAILIASFELLHLSRVGIAWGSIYYIHIWGYLFTWAALLAMEPMLFKVQKRRTKQEAALVNIKNKESRVYILRNQMVVVQQCQVA
ncbi:MBOAT, membrane-bound O-acyltransferase family-domain-containing protein [Zychaea mexicana]|uniref:MBOAT, membrane-bound O-acyltransferase family-domain-containing protein n=1 Tax=Zychaea mexicana TaxID=64656 RepID=UPI0022FF29AA|nr:MBOAT, membrane-bound O-acyltransferase family-domain-containing protein [Zychaea mexicana]KAI9493694.1 MBOAT, membrane-bound O-acyltransferase family-domain-containing protein [Zychaea mexicana]